ncbi:Signal transduction histidine kinase [Micromonospora phaseoli]|uniref:histidine kinase n=1 Tax=Micromonospora phaseoli TaxID=1144548 RepID=A0A1H6UTJ6_9ACTN|nr:sensor histidine kinase [Micromonospora phaseoli]PZV99153.1 signal transduction histidine kinase [Micromonospora phaseoli]GIJ78645.1 two-component sensor histidine kinase [Micromonospora phaseoli]SEI95679.1 Signal transduction histidine kinase [Micromonospora phaseoli]
MTVFVPAPQAVEQPGRFSWLVDLLVAGAVGAAMTVFTLVASEPTSRSAGLAAYALGVALGAMLVFRRRWPMGVLVGSLLAVLAYNLTDFPSVSPVWPLLVPLYTIARAGRLLAASLVGGAMLLISVGWFAWSRPQPLELLDGALRESVLLALALALATATRHREMWGRELRARLRMEQDQRDRELSRRLVEERLRIAHELHDVTAHTLAVVGIQAGLARELMHDDPAAAQEALETAERVNTEAIGELQAAVRVLRGGDVSPPPELAPTPGLTQLPALIATAGENGLDTTLVQSGHRRDVAPAVGLTVYRVVQESLTNVLKHADATQATVTVDYADHGIRVRVGDNGRGTAPTVTEGHGLTGMRERVTSIGGSITVGPDEDGGFMVDARLPWTYALGSQLDGLVVGGRSAG